MDTNNLEAVELKTSAYLSFCDQILHFKFPSATILDVCLIWGLSFISGLIDNKFIVGMNLALLPYFSRFPLYYSAVISVNTSRLSNLSYSSLYNLFKVSLSGFLFASTVCKFVEAQVELWRFAADRCLSIPNTCRVQSCYPTLNVFSYIRTFKLYYVSDRE